MANYSINPNGVLDTAAELAAVTKLLERSLDTLEACVARFTAANNGDGPDSFTAAQSLWGQGQKEMNIGLINGQAALEEITRQYVLSDNRAASVFGGTV